MMTIESQAKKKKKTHEIKQLRATHVDRVTAGTSTEPHAAPTSNPGRALQHHPHHETRQEQDKITNTHTHALTHTHLQEHLQEMAVCEQGPEPATEPLRHPAQEIQRAHHEFLLGGLHLLQKGPLNQVDFFNSFERSN